MPSRKGASSSLWPALTDTRDDVRRFALAIARAELRAWGWHTRVYELADAEAKEVRNLAYDALLKAGEEGADARYVLLPEELDPVKVFSLTESTKRSQEMKADLVSLFALHAFNQSGSLDAASLRAVQASGILRTLQNVRPREDQPYQRMQLVQFNWFLEHGLIRADPKIARLTVQYDRYMDTVGSLLKEVLALQHAGDKAATAKFFERWSTWTPELHDVLAARIREAQGARFRVVRYGALGEK